MGSVGEFPKNGIRILITAWGWAPWALALSQARRLQGPGKSSPGAPGHRRSSKREVWSLRGGLRLIAGLRLQETGRRAGGLYKKEDGLRV